MRSPIPSHQIELRRPPLPFNQHEILPRRVVGARRAWLQQPSPPLPHRCPLPRPQKLLVHGLDLRLFGFPTAPPQLSWDLLPRPPQAGRRAGAASRASRESPRPPRDALPEIELRRSGVHHGSPKSAHPRPLPPRCCPANGPEPLLHREKPTGRRASCRTCNQNQAPASATPSPSTPPQGTENPPGPF